MVVDICQQVSINIINNTSTLTKINLIQGNKILDHINIKILINNNLGIINNNFKEIIVGTSKINLSIIIRTGNNNIRTTNKTPLITKIIIQINLRTPMNHRILFKITPPNKMKKIKFLKTNNQTNQIHRII